MIRSWSRPVALAAFAASLAACAGDAATAPSGTVSDAEITADVAAQSGDAIALDLASFTDGEVTAGLSPAMASAPFGVNLSLSAGQCPYSAGRFRCGSTTNNSVTTTHSYAFFDANGAAMTSYDAQLTASMNLQTSVSGTASGTTKDGTFSVAFHRSRNRTVSGLAGTETQRTWNGTGAGFDTSTVTNSRVTRHYAGSAADTSTNVVVKLPRSSNPWPISGQHVRVTSVSASVEGARTGARQATRRAVVTFNGTATVPLTLGTTTCTLHLDTRKVDGCAQAQ